MAIVFGCISPHPPIIVREVGQGREWEARRTIEALEQVARGMARHRPETAILISPHCPLRRDAFGVLVARRSEGSFQDWGAPGVIMSFENDLEAVALIREEAQAMGVPVEPLRRWNGGLDWGCTVPLYYLRPGLAGARLVPLTVSLLPPREHFRWGQAVGRAAARLGRRVAVIASADLSHCLHRDGPYGYDPAGPAFDEAMQRAVAQWGVEAVLSMEPAPRERAKEDAVPSVSFLMGALDGLQVRPQVLSYEGPFGVGYMVAIVEVEGT